MNILFINKTRVVKDEEEKEENNKICITII